MEKIWHNSKEQYFVEKLSIEVKKPFLKRPFDFVLSTLGLIFSFPIWLLIAIAIKLEDQGPIFFIQERWGRFGEVIKVIKFRTMVPNAGNCQVKKRDDRITQVGRVLRATGIDELPQLLAIWKGDMSFVGPRPLAVHENDSHGNEINYKKIPGFWRRLSVRPGLTSLSTVFKRKDIHPKKKVKYDLIYIQKQSFLLDCKLIFLSVWISLKGNWESRGKKL